MNSFFDVLGLPGEVRNHIYEYAAYHERYLRIKSKLRPRNTHHVAARHGLVLANRQISEEYTGIVQDEAEKTDITLVTRVHDFNFRHVEKYLSTIRNHVSQGQLGGKMVRVELIISACNHFDTESFASWVSQDDRNGYRWTYSVDDERSGHRFPMPPPNDHDMEPFQKAAQSKRSARRVHRALQSWQSRRWAPFYHRENDRSEYKLRRWRVHDRSSGNRRRLHKGE